MKLFRHVCSIAVAMTGISVSPVKVYRIMADLATAISLDFVYLVIIAITILDFALLFRLYSQEFVTQICKIAGLPRIRQSTPFGPYRPY